MTIWECREKYAGKFAAEEIYRFTGHYHKLHHAYMDRCSDYYDDEKVAVYELMSETAYNKTFFPGNKRKKADFEEWFGDKKARILVIALTEDYDQIPYWL